MESLKITEEKNPEMYKSYHEFFSKKAAEAQKIIKILETVSNIVGECYSPSILLTGFGELEQHDPYFKCTDWLYIDGKRAGIMTIGHEFYAPKIFNQYDKIYKIREVIQNRHTKLESEDPAFEIIRQLDNNWWGRRPERSTAHPHPVTDKILDDLCQVHT